MLEISDLVKSFDGERRASRAGKKALAAPRVMAVDGVSLTVERGELFTLLGPSGCGKTTTLRSIAGLERPDSGSIVVDDRVLFSAASGRKTVNVPVPKRELGMVFQSYAIWPHMTVFDNVAFPLTVMPRGKRPGKAAISERVSRVLDTMELGQYAERRATQLSGGQQQRLALARAIVVEPALLLLDEPLSNLDAKLRESLRYELKRLQRELGITSIYVTHDQIEALALSTHIAVMRNGSVEQLGRPREIYESPKSRFVAEFIGTSNFLPGVVKAREGNRYVVESRDGSLSVECPSTSIRTGSDAIVSIRPEAVSLSVERPHNAENVWTGKVLARAYLGDAVDHIVAVGGQEVRARCAPSTSVEPGTEVHLEMKPDQLSLVPVD